MSPFLQFFAMVGTTFFAENLVLSRAFGVSELLALTRKRQKLGLICLCATLLSTVSCFFSWLFVGFAVSASLLPLIYLSVLLPLYLLLAFVAQRMEEGAEFLRAFRPVAFGSSLAGVMLLAMGKEVTLPGCLGLGLGGGMGFCLALFFTLQSQRHFSESNVPKPFRGLPVSLLYLGLLSLAFHGILGAGLSS